MTPPVSSTDATTTTMSDTTTAVDATTTSVTTDTFPTPSTVVPTSTTNDAATTVPSETQVLNVINTLLKSRGSKLKKLVQVLNFTYKNISANSYTIIFTLNLINISISEDPELKGNTYQHLQNVINNVLNTLLNEPSSKDFEAKSSKFTCTENHIEGSMEYIFNDTDQPTIFLKDLNLQNSLITTTLATPGTSKSTKETTTLIRRVIFDIQLNFITPGPIPSESHVLQLVDSLLAPRLRPKEETAQTPSDPVSYVNASYEKTSDNSYVLKFGFEINNPSMAEKLELRDGNYAFIQNSMKRKLNQILSDSDTSVELNKVNFVNNSMEVIANVDYVFLQQDIKSPSVFIQELLKVMNSLTTPIVDKTTQNPEETPNVIGRVIIYIRLIFITQGPIPSEAKVLQLANSLLATRLRTKRELRAQILATPVSFVNVYYTKISDTSYALNFGFEISNVTIPEKSEFRDSTFKLIQDSINKLLNEILTEPTATPFVFNDANFTINSTTIQAEVQYVFSESDIQKPSAFLYAVILVNNETITTTTPAATSTPFYFTVLNTTITNNSTSAAWVVGIIVPCAIAIFLVPCWILLCFVTFELRRQITQSTATPFVYMVMTLNSRRRWFFISKYDVRWTSFLTILYVWCIVCGGTSSVTTPGSTASEVCAIRTKASITTPMTPKQNMCTAMTFTTTSPTTTDSTSMASSRTTVASTENAPSTTATGQTAISSLMTTETKAFTTTDVTPTATLISSPSTTVPLTATNAASTTAPSLTTEASTTAYVNPTTLSVFSASTATDDAPTTVALSSTAETSTAVTPTTTFISLATAPTTTTTAPTPSSNTEGYTTQDVSPTTTLISSPATTAPSTATNTAPTVAGQSSTTEASTTTDRNPTTMPENENENVTTTTTLLSSITEASTTTAVNPTTTLESSPTTTNSAPTVAGQSSTTESSKTTGRNPTSLPVFSVPPATENVTTTTLLSSTTEASTTTAVNPTTTFISSASVPTTTSNAAPTPSSTTEGYTTQAVSPTATLISSETTTAKAAPTTPLSTTIEASGYTTTAVTPTTLLVFSGPTVTPPTLSSISSTSSLVSLSTTTTSSTTIPLFTTSTRSPASTTFVTPTTMPMFSEFTKSFLTTTSLPNATTNAVTPTQLSETQSPAPTAFQSQSTVSLATTETTAPTVIIVTQETTIPLTLTKSGAATSMPITTAATIALTQTTAMVISKLVFNSSSPVPSEALVLSAINTLRNSRESQLNESVKVVNVTYEKISETAYAVVFTFNVLNISMPENPELRENTHQQVQNTINNALNTLLNEPDQQIFEPKSSNFTSTSNQINGRMDYTFQEGDAIQPFSFLNELRLPTTTTVFPETTTGFSVTTPNLISGSAVVISKLVFNSSSPVPSEALVLSAINTLRNSRESQLSESVKVVNVTYEKISETAYAVVFTFNVLNISMPENPELRENTHQQVQNTINNALNTLLNEPDQQIFEPKSSNFTSTSNQIDGRMDYTFQEGDAIQPFSFLNELRLPTTTTVFPETTTGFSVTTPNLISGSAVVINKLVFNSSSPVPSEALVLSAINTLRNSRESQLNESVKVVNVTYEKISETAYAVVFTFNVLNISMPENPELRENTHQQVQNTINNALNTLLNEPDQQIFEPKSSNFTSTSNQIDGRMDYTFQEGDAIQPFSFLNELRLPTTTTVFPETTTGFSVTTPNLISGSAVVISKLVFNSSSPVPSEALVLSAINTLRNSRESQLSESVKVVNVTYEKISETAYAVVFTFNVLNISMPENPELRENTHQQVQNTINNALNTLLNEPDQQIFEPKSSNFTSTSNQIDGRMDYTFQEGDAIQPFSFLNELRLPTTTTVFPETTTGFSVTTPNLISGSAVVISKLVFNSSSPVPSEALVLSAINTLRNSRESQLNESVKVVNVTYEKISETAYAVVFTFNVLNISMPENPELRENTHQQVQNTINNALNTLLNEPDQQIFEPKSSNFTSTSNQIDGRMDYTFQEGDAIQPFSFLNELRLPTTTTVFPETTTGFSVTTPNLISGSAVVISKLVFNSSSPVPSEALVLSAINTLRNSRESQLSESVKVVNVTYEKISETAYAVVFTFNVLNISMPENPELRENTHQQVQNTINNALNTLLNEPDQQIFEPKSSNFTSTSNQIDGRMDYTFQEGDAIQPFSFLNELRLPTTTTVFPETTTGFSVTTPNLISGSAVVISKLVFNSSSPVPSEALVLSAINTLRNSRESQLSESVKVVNVTYEKISETAYAVVFTFNVLNISMPENPELRENTHQQVQNTINNALNTLLNEPDQQIFEPKSSNFISTSNQIDGRMDYTFQEGDAIQPVSFLNELRLPTTTTVFPETTTGFSVTTPNLISGSAVVISKLVFNSSSPVPSEALVLSAINTLRNSRESQLSESVKVVNVTYEKISETAYAVVFTFNVLNISMPENPELRENTHQQVQNTINNALNTLLNEPDQQIFEPKSSNFTSTSNQIDGRMDYTFQEGDAIQPFSFLNELRLPTTTTVFPETTTGFSVTTPNLISGSAVVISKLVFNSSSPVPSEALVLSAINTLRNSRESQLSESVKVVNVTYEKISETAYAVVFTFNVLNISMPENPELRENTHQQVQNTINNALNTLLNEPDQQIFEPKSSNFISTSNQIDGRMDYTFQEGDAIQPVSFLNELRLPTTTTVFPETTTGFSVTTPNLISGSAVVISKLVFNSSSPVPSEALVLSAINTLRNSRESQLSESVKVVNVTYEKISETAYAVVFTFNVLNISMPENPELRENTHQQVQNTINNALNTLLNEPDQQIFEPKSSNFTSTSNQIDGRMDYTFQEGDAIQPVSFLNELRLPTTTTVFPETTTGFSVTTPNLISGSAVVISKLVFNSSSPVPSEALVLSAINTLRNSRESQLSESVKVVNVTYEKISETAYAVVFTFNVLNISMPENPELRENTHQQVQNTINNALNTLLNEPDQPVFEPKSYNFTSTSNQIDDRMDYTFQEGDAIQPVSFLNELRLPTTTTVFPEPKTGFPTTSPNLISGSAVVISKLVFNSSSPVPSEALVLSAINTLRNSRESQLSESVKVVNVTYEKISETAYAVVFTFNVLNISMPENPELRENTHQQVQNTINNALNTLLNEPDQPVFEPKSYNFTSTSNQIDDRMDYTFQEGDAIQPVSFLNELRLPTTTTVFPEPKTGFPTTSPNLISGSAVVISKLVFNSTSPVPSEALVLSAINTLRNSRRSQLNESVKVVNVTYEKISETVYAVVFTFNVLNISMPENPELRENTHQQVQNTINIALNTLLNEPKQPVFEPKSSNFTSTSNQIDDRMDYTFQEGDAIQPVSFLNELLLTTASTPTTSTTTPPNLLGKVIIYIKLVFRTQGTIPSESNVIQVANTLLNGMKLKITRDLTAKELTDLVSFVNVTYTKINDSSFSLNFGFEISNVSMSERLEFRNETNKVIGDYMNSFLSKILNKTTTANFDFNAISFNGSSNVIEAKVEYVFTDSDIATFGLVSTFLGTTTTVAPTTFYPTVLNTTISNNGTNAAWVVAIIVPVAIVIGLVPCWILLCCLLCGCCAAIRRRWHRRRSYNVQYSTRNSIF
ncbi:hypothetical protein Q8A67_004973 [Cirrhinus molitorella]|uniref:Uncharacterized protein n=1 Tax=Cirrhinus molitorella TaxID=172907 RepID=A0AA88TU76_9TELE|nr:hypothetical protein Q8A67_004973 [Cirrhinus molitorella]